MKEFTIVTDCEYLVYAQTSKNIIKWLSEAAYLNFNICHRKGERMKHVDTLSRAPVEDHELIASISEKVFQITTYDEEMYQHSDVKLLKKIKILSKPVKNRTRREKSEVNGYVLRDG